MTKKNTPGGHAVARWRCTHPGCRYMTSTTFADIKEIGTPFCPRHDDELEVQNETWVCNRARRPQTLRAVKPVARESASCLTHGQLLTLLKRLLDQHRRSGLEPQGIKQAHTITKFNEPDELQIETVDGRVYVIRKETISDYAAGPLAD